MTVAGSDSLSYCVLVVGFVHRVELPISAYNVRLIVPPTPRTHLLQRDIYNNSKLLVELCVSKLDQDWFVLLELLAIVFNPASK